jgi:hypothetical protein
MYPLPKPYGNKFKKPVKKPMAPGGIPSSGGGGDIDNDEIDDGVGPTSRAANNVKRSAMMSRMNSIRKRVR